MNTEGIKSFENKKMLFEQAMRTKKIRPEIPPYYRLLKTP